jgi:hypothetical protein
MTEEYVCPFSLAVLKRDCQQFLMLLPAIFMSDSQVLSWKLYIFRFYDGVLFRVLYIHRPFLRVCWQVCCIRLQSFEFARERFRFGFCVCNIAL